MKKRLTVEGDGGSDDRRIMSLLKTFIKWCNSRDHSEEEREATYQKMLFTLGEQAMCVYVCSLTINNHISLRKVKHQNCTVVTCWECTTRVWCVFTGQCEFSFLKTEVVMEMNKREMERYEEVYR